MPALKNAKWELFAQGIAKGLSATEAMSEVGYSDPRNSTRLMKNDEIAARIAELKERGAQRAEVSIERVLTELGRIGFSDLRKGFDENGNIKRVEDWSDDFAAAVASVEVITRSLGAGEVEHVHKLRLWDKNSALEKIAKHLGALVDRVDVTNSDRSMQPVNIDATKLSLETLKELMDARRRPEAD